MEERTCDVVVIGAGPGGEVAAGRLAEAGKDVVIVERELVGGECSFWGCMPSKALLRPAALLAEIRRVPGLDVGDDPSVDADAALARRDEVIHDLDDNVQVPWLEDRGITLLRAHGRLDGPRTVVAGDLRLTARDAVIIGVGTTASLPPVDGLEDAAPWTNREVTTAQSVPDSLAVLGGGPIGCEMAQAYRSLGARVTVLEVADRLLAQEEEDASAAVARSMAEQGIDVRCGAVVSAVARDGDGGPVTLTIDGGADLVADELLVAAGRRARTEDLGLETVGVEADGPIAVDERLRVPGHDWLYVVGDANGRALLTHVGKHQARIAADVILGGLVALRPTIDPPPRVTFTEPQVAAVGYTLAQALDAGIPARSYDAPTSQNAGGSFHGRGTDGRSRIVVDTARGVVVGATFVGPDVAEFLHAATIALVGAVPIDDLVHAIPPFPTRSELWLELVEQARADGVSAPRPAAR